MPFYRKKPVVIEAMRYTGTPQSTSDLLNFMGKLEIKDFKPVIDTLEGRMTVSVGDWVIKGVTGEFYPCRHHIFIETYDEEPEGD